MMDIWDPAAKTPVTTTDNQEIAEPGLDLVKHFEGCSLTAYPDPGTGGDPWTIGYNQNEFDATVSFTYNYGAGALESSTFRRRINAGEDKATCFREEFPKWVNGGNGPMPGLVRRREAEVQLATS